MQYKPFFSISIIHFKACIADIVRHSLKLIISVRLRSIDFCHAQQKFPSFSLSHDLSMGINNLPAHWAATSFCNKTQWTKKSTISYYTGHHLMLLYKTVPSEVVMYRNF